jgi:DNA-directed RNA polymerase subunit RPC12/RpoP
MPNYVDNKDFLNLILQYKKRKTKKVANQIGRIFINIATNYIRSPCFVNYSTDLKQDMLSSAIFFMWKYLDGYRLYFCSSCKHKWMDESKKCPNCNSQNIIYRDNPLAYYTSFAFNAYLQILNEWHKQKEIFTSYTFLENLDDNFSSKDLMRKYKEIPKVVTGNIKELLKEIEEVDKLELPDCKKESEEE